MAAPCCSRTNVRLLSALCCVSFSLLLFVVVPVSSRRHLSSAHDSQTGRVLYYSPDSRFQDQLSPKQQQQRHQQNLPASGIWDTVLQRLRNHDDLNNAAVSSAGSSSSSDGLSQLWDNLRHSLEIPRVRHRREVTEANAHHSVPEDINGQLVDLVLKFSSTAPQNFEMVSASAHQEMFEVTLLGKLNLKDGYQLDYEDSTMRTIAFLIDATNRNNASDVTRIRLSLSVTNVNEPPVFITEPKPYRATISTDTGPGHVIITLVAQDPEGQTVTYTKSGVQPQLDYDQRIEVKTENVNGVLQCQLLTRGLGRFPDNGEISITVTASDDPNGGNEATATVFVKVGVLPPQFYEGSYQGSMHEKNQAGQSVYKFGTQEELRIRYKTFQPGTVTTTLEEEGGGVSSLFSMNSEGYIICDQVLDYETINPKIQSLTVKASQRVGNTNQISEATLTVQIIDANDHTPTFDKSQYLKSLAENVDLDFFVLDVTARDGDTGDNARIVYSLVEADSDSQYFQITTMPSATTPTVYTGEIRVKQRLDYDRKEGPYYNFRVVATDSGEPVRSSTTSVRVTVSNVNDEKPQFTTSGDEVNIVMMNAPVGQFIAQVQATDKDGDRVSYRITSTIPSSSYGTPVNIDSSTGVISLARLIQPDDDRFTVTVMAQDDGSCCTGTSSLSSTVEIIVQVSGENENKPTFGTCSSYSRSINEHTPIGQSVLQVSANDSDRGPNGKVTYKITPSDMFTINSTTGVLSVGMDIDRESLADPYKQITVRAEDGGNPPLTGWCTFRMTIADINDHPPVFGKSPYRSNITVALQPKVPFLTITASDQDVGPNARISYSLVDDAEGKFGIIPENGYVFLENQLTQTDKTYTLRAMAKDNGTPSKNETVDIIVQVKTGTTQPPTWDRDYSSMVITVNESVVEGTPIMKDMACSSNIEDRRVEFQLIDDEGNPVPRTDYFYLGPPVMNSNTVTVFATGNFDYYVKQEIELKIRCLNFGAVTLMNETRPRIRLEDTNNQIPMFQGLEDGRYLGAVKEGAPPQTSVITVTATDKDATDLFSRVTFTLSQDGTDFTIDQGPTLPRNTAIIRTNRTFDREKLDGYVFQVHAEDGAPSAKPSVFPNPNKVVSFCQVKILDINDNEPYFQQQLYHIEVDESYYLNQQIDPAIRVDDKDSSDTGRHTYRITQGNGNPATFGVRNGLGNLFLLRSLDYERGDKNFLLTLEASDGQFSASTSVTVTVRDVNDNSPVFLQETYTFTDIVENDNNPNNPILTVSATDADKERPNQIRYRLTSSSFNVDDYFSLNPENGELSVIRALDRDLPNGFADYQMTVEATDELDNPNRGFASVSVRPQDVNDNAPFFLDTPLVGSVDEHSPLGSSVVLIRSNDYDEGENSTVDMTITSITNETQADRSGYFVINGDTLVTNTNPDNLDRETEDTYYVAIKLSDRGNPVQTATGTLTVTLSDIDDMTPTFEQNYYSAEMSESQISGQVIRIKANDRDLGDNAKVTYELIKESDRTHFQVEDVNGWGSIQVFTPVDYENTLQREFNLTLEAKDNAGHKDVCYVYIKVTDFNDNVPNISPKSGTANVSEDARPGKRLFQFSAMDLDSGMNKEFEFSISRKSDPLRQFFIDPVSGEVKTHRPLDRETKAMYTLTIQAIDKGDPPKTGEATLTVDVLDVNDNYPKFKYDYHPHVMENDKSGVKRVVQEILADDPDDPPYDIPYGFALTTCPGNSCPCSVKPTCENTFSFRFNEGGDGGNGTAIISTFKTDFDREKQKYYEIPIVMWDMRGKGSNEAMTGTNTLTVTIADVNDNPMFPGTQDIFVYNYKGSFGPLGIGRVYVEDLDDWDLDDKNFFFNGPAWMEAYFKVDNDTGMVIMQKGVPSNTAQNPYTFSVDVVDNALNLRVTSTVTVVVHDLTEEAVRNSGAARLKDISAEEFIKVPKASASQAAPRSKSDIFQAMLAKELKTDVSNVQIISVQDVEGGFVDVRYSVHGSPYYPPSQTDSMVYLNKDKFEQAMDTTLSVPIDACSEEVFEGGCYNYMNITGQPVMVNANGTSFVGVEVFIQAKEGCRALDFPEPEECSGDYCYHGGTCVKDDFGVLSCKNCPAGFDGPRCQQLSHSFNGNQYAMYATLEQCEDSETSIEFVTKQVNDGLLFYNGPLAAVQDGEPEDFIALALHSGMPVLNINHGSGAMTVTLNGKDKDGNQVMTALNDGNWHKIDIIRKGKVVEMVVDDCQAAGNSGTMPPDTSPCRTVAMTPGENSFLNVASLLQVGGRPKSASYPSSAVVTTSGFDGCVKNLIHNSKIYDLHFKPRSTVPSGENGCPRENCNNQCGANGICTGSLNPSQPFICTCKPGWIGDICDTAATTRDLQSSSYIQWQLKNGVTLPSNKLEVQIMYRTYDTAGVLFAISSQESTIKSVSLELMDGRLQALYDLGDGERNLTLSNVNASNGQWHLARFERVMHRATLTLDGGEGARQATQHAGASDNVYMTVRTNSSMYAGAIITSSQGAERVNRDLTNTCIRDVRLNNMWLPMTNGENPISSAANFVRDQNVNDGCTRPNGCLTPPSCPANAVCVDLWGWYKCKCSSGYHDLDGGVCQSDCLPDNPCFHNADCSIDNGTVACDCAPFVPWSGQFCSIYINNPENEPAMGIAGGTIAAIVVAIIVAIVLLMLAILLVTMYNRRKKNADEKFVVEDDADFDIRENVMYYDEEGAGEEDQNAYDLAKLPNPVSEPIRPDHVDDVHRRNAVPLGKSVPDVGDVLHDRMGDADNDPGAPPYDTLIAFNDEGTGSDAGSLSSLGSSSSDASQDYDYLNDWGPKFAKLADMYGAGQNE